MRFRTLLPAVLLLLTACTLSNGKGGGQGLEKTYYFDAQLGFTVDYPATWSRQRSRDEPVVRWRDDDDHGAEALIAARPLAPTTGGYDQMAAKYTLSHPDVAIRARKKVELGDNLPVLRIDGATTRRTILAYLVKTERRAYVLEFSAPSEHFSRYRGLFEEMAHSFQPL